MCLLTDRSPVYLSLTEDSFKMTCWLCGFQTTELVTNAKPATCKNGPCQICIAVANVDEEINQAVATLRRLLVKRCDLRSEQNRVHGSLHRLPVELKNYIFELVLPSQDEWGYKVERPSSGVMPSYLTSICRGWCDIARSNPLLWSTINIALGTPAPTSDLSSRIEFLQDCIRRSQTLPLTLHIVAHQEQAELNGIIDVISQCSNRWHSLSLDMPMKLLLTFQHSNFQCRHLKKLRIITAKRSSVVNQPLPFLNPRVSPENIEIRGVSPQSLQISWNHLTSAIVERFELEEITQLLQHASQMTVCHILSPRRHPSFSMAPIIHPRLKTLSLCHTRYSVAILLGSLTLPCLEELYATELDSLIYLPALVHRSSCPLNRITFFKRFRWDVGTDLQPLPGVTDLVVESMQEERSTGMARKFLLGEHFPDLRHLTLGIQPFCCLWAAGVISMLLRPCRFAANGGRLRKILVVGRRPGEFNALWNSCIGQEVRESRFDINLREDSFEFLIPEA